MKSWIFGLLLVFLGGTAQAEEVLKGDFEACIQAQVDAKAPIIDCVTEAHVVCADFPPGEAAELQCYQKAKDEWGVRLAQLLDSFSDREPDLQEVARIEAKYAVLRNMMNCDLRIELGLVGREPDPQDQLVRAKCESLGIAASLVEVLIKSGTVTR